MNVYKEINVTLIILYIKLTFQLKENDTNDKAYIGMISWNWLFRYYNHLQTFKNPTLRNQTALYKLNWYLIELIPVMNYKILKRPPRKTVDTLSVIYALERKYVYWNIWMEMLISL